MPRTAPAEEPALKKLAPTLRKNGVSQAPGGPGAPGASGASGLRIEGLGFGMWSLGFRVKGLGCGV